MEEDLVSAIDLSKINRNSVDSDDWRDNSSSGLETCRIKSVECTLYWKNVLYAASENNNQIQSFLSRHTSIVPAPQTTDILYDISGFAKPGEFLAIIGPSGAGKTSLLNVLANRVHAEGGEITVNGESIKKSSKYTRLVGYVLQHDSHLPFLTVYETMFYAGMLTLPRSLSLKTKLARINSLIFELGLDKCAHSYVGNTSVRGISGGELKRLSIGVELLRDPAILFLDEPTSGLDANTSLQVVEQLRTLAKKYGHTVITTIHQPRSQIFKKFDNLLILASGGRQIYFGKADEALGYFSKLGYESPMHENPADYFLDITSIDYNTPDDFDESCDRVDILTDAWEKEPIPTNPTNNSGLQGTSPEPSATWLSQVFWIMHRETLNDLRNFRFNATRFVQNFVVSFFLGWLYFRLGDDQSTIPERTGLLFFTIIVVSYHEMLSALTVFISQRDVLFRERDSGFYSTSAYWAGKQLALLPFQMLYPFIFIMCMYWLSGLQTTWYKFFIFFAVLELVGLYCSSLGLLLGAALPPTIAVTVGPLTNVYSSISVGFLANLDNIPVPFNYLTFLSYARYAYDAVVQNEFTGLKLTCKSDQLSGGECPFTTGEQVIDSLDISELDYYQNMLVIFGFIVVYKLFLYVVLRHSRPAGR